MDALCICSTLLVDAQPYLLDSLASIDREDLTRNVTCRIRGKQEDGEC